MLLKAWYQSERLQSMYHQKLTMQEIFLAARLSIDINLWFISNPLRKIIWLIHTTPHRDSRNEFGLNINNYTW
jgi:hypothetical protein